MTPEARQEWAEHFAKKDAPPQLTVEEMLAMSAEEIAKAYDAGQLDDVLGRTAKKAKAKAEAEKRDPIESQIRSTLGLPDEEVPEPSPTSQTPIGSPSIVEGLRAAMGGES